MTAAQNQNIEKPRNCWNFQQLRGFSSSGKRGIRTYGFAHEKCRNYAIFIAACDIRVIWPFTVQNPQVPKGRNRQSYADIHSLSQR